MIKIVSGGQGEGKTKQLIEMANAASNTSLGHVVYIDHDRKYMYDLHHDIRFIETQDFPIEDYKEFFGFLCGIISEDRDIDHIFIDGLLKIAHLGVEDIMNFIEKLKKVSDACEIKFIISMNCKSREIPESLKPFLVA